MSEPRHCRQNHRRPVRAVTPAGFAPLCRMHYNRLAQDHRIRRYIEDEAPRCPDHSDRTPRVTRWYSQSRPVLTCPTGIGEPVVSQASGRGAFRTPSQRSYTQWCAWRHEVPERVLAAVACDHAELTAPNAHGMRRRSLRQEFTQTTMTLEAGAEVSHDFRAHIAGRGGIVRCRSPVRAFPVAFPLVALFPWYAHGITPSFKSCIQAKAQPSKVSMSARAAGTLSVDTDRRDVHIFVRGLCVRPPGH